MNALQDELDQNLNSIKGIKLTEGNSSLKRQNRHHFFVTESRNVNAVCQEIVECLAKFLLQRIDINDQLVHILKPFTNLKPLTQVHLKEVHQTIGNDLDITKLSLEYAEVLELEEIENLHKMSMAKLVDYFATYTSFNTIIIIISRILVAKPHSTDVERLISTSNILKSSDRQSLLVETEYEYLFIHFNMPPSILWDPRPATLLWINSSNRQLKETSKAREQV
uniref:Uncharacterized protein n=1 Tax=Sipha flava TaxID=143950 RepID=A0A2S2R0M5_9HEMI